MPGLNKVQLIGNLGADPETRFTTSGKKVTNFRMAVTRRWRDSEGEQKVATEWVNIDTWGGLADISAKYLKKGSLVYVEGRLQTDKWEVEGEPRSRTKVVASQIEMLDRKSGDGGSEESAEGGEETPF